MYFDPSLLALEREVVARIDDVGCFVSFLVETSLLRVEPSLLRSTPTFFDEVGRYWNFSGMDEGYIILL